MANLHGDAGQLYAGLFAATSAVRRFKRAGKTLRRSDSVAAAKRMLVAGVYKNLGRTRRQPLRNS